MKQLIKISILILSLNCFSQTLDFSVPLKTKHFQNENYVNQVYAEGEGGNIGLILTYSPKKEKRIKDNYTIGAYRNSFGDFTATALYGKNFFISKNTNLSVNVGVATGYKKLYDSRMHFKHSGKIISEDYKGDSFIKNNGLSFVYTISMQQVIYKNTYLIASVNHLFINFGVGYRLNFKN